MQLSLNLNKNIEIASFRSLSRLPCGSADAALRERL
jgi:hypothetical protein